MAGKIIVKAPNEYMGVGKLTVYINSIKQDIKLGRAETAEFSIDNASNIYGSLTGGLKSSSINVSANMVSEIEFCFKKGTWKNTLDIRILKETPIAQYVDTTEKAVFEFDGGVGDKLTVYEDRIVIKHKGVLNLMAMGIHGDKTIYYSDLTAIQFKAGGMLAGHIQFSVLGGNESRGGVLSASGDENTVTFNADKNREAQTIHEYLNNKLKEIKTGKNAPIVQSVAVSVADELKKFKELLDMGVITQEEFDTKKKQLLGL